MKNHPSVFRTFISLISIFIMAHSGCAQQGESAGGSIVTTEKWVPIDLSFTADEEVAQAYRAIDFWAEFTNETGRVLRRPGFWDGGRTWRLRFAAPEGTWRYRTFCAGFDGAGLSGQQGQVVVVPPAGPPRAAHRGPLRMSPQGRNVVFADGSPFMMVADTPWALPFRGTPATVAHYAQSRQQQGFNAALLMTVQPDQRARGPRDRSLPGSFGVGFHDLSEGGLNELNVDYFQYLDQLLETLQAHEIVPVFSPVFQGFGWKGLGTLGHSADPQEYVRFFKYLIARYGASPAMWLVSADAASRSPVVVPAGELVEAWDAYQQPAGLHYSPYDDTQPDWSDDPAHAPHHNQQHQAADWLDFQWAQTGHNAIHMPEKVAAMFANKPSKAAANGEPTYERIGSADKATGWWQGHEAWLNLTSGGTMGVVYGAGGLWNWKLAADEPGWPDWANTAASWSDAVEFEGARYVGYISRAFEGMPFLAMAPRPDLAGGQRLVAVPGKFYLCYLPEGGTVTLADVPPELVARWFDPQQGVFQPIESVKSPTDYVAPSSRPWVLVIGPVQ